MVVKSAQFTACWLKRPDSDERYLIKIRDLCSGFCESKNTMIRFATFKIE